MRKYLLCIVFISNFILAAAADQRDELIVAIKEESPFVIQNDKGEYSGLSVELWKSLADQLNIKFKFREYNDNLGILRALHYKEVDICINPLHVNQTRLELFDISQPFFISSIGVATTSIDSSRLLVFLRNFFSFDFLRIILFLIMIIFSFGLLLWTVERRYNKRQFRPGLSGVFDGLWWSAVTMTTVGYGDKAPRTKAGRIIAMIWMFTAIVIISGFTATIASTLTVRAMGAQVEKLQDLATCGKIGTVYASSAEEFLKNHEINSDYLFDSPEEGLISLARKDIEVLVFDKTVLNYLINTNQMAEEIDLLPINFNKQYRSFFSPKKSEIMEKIDPLLIAAINDISFQEIIAKYNLAID